MKVHVISIVLSTALFAGCGGGGGGSSSSPDPVVPDLSGQTLAEAAQVVNVQSAVDAGYTGTGIVVAVVDSGIRASHTVFSSAHILLGDAWNFVDDNADVTDTSGHGTSVSSVIVGSGDVRGIAPGASLLPVRHLDQDKTGSWPVTKDAVLYASDHAKVINMSFEVNSELDAAAWLDQIAAKGVVGLIAPGNNGEEHPRFAELFDQDGFLDVLPASEGHFLAVGATTADGSTLASYSAKAGVMKDRFIVAPGSFLVADASSDTAQTLAAGTSFSTPMVSAAVALMWQANPSLTPTEVTGLLCSTAQDMGAPGHDEIYGCGLLDIGAAVTAAVAAGEK